MNSPTTMSCLLRLLLLRSAPFTRRWCLYHVARLFLLALYTYGAALIALVLLEDRLLFHPVKAETFWLEPLPELQIQDLQLISADGTRLHAWWSAPADWRPEAGAVLYSHGRGGNVSRFLPLIAEWRQRTGMAVLVYDYPGFGRSDGTPTEANCYAAGEAAFDYLQSQQMVPADRIVLHGESFGGAIATELASRHPCRALLLASTFTSFPDMAEAKYPIFPGRWLAHNQFRTLDKLAHITAPVFVAHGTADELVPFGQGQRLFAAAPGPKRFCVIEQGTHALPRSRVIEEFLQFLHQTEAGVQP